MCIIDILSTAKRRISHSIYTWVCIISGISRSCLPSSQFGEWPLHVIIIIIILCDIWTQHMGAATHSCDFPIGFLSPPVSNALLPFCALYAHGNAAHFSVGIRRKIRSCYFRQYFDGKYSSTVFLFIYFLIFSASLSKRHTIPNARKK